MSVIDDSKHEWQLVSTVARNLNTIMAAFPEGLRQLQLNTENPLYLGVSQLDGDRGHSAIGKGNSATLFRISKMLGIRADVVVRALTSRRARALSMSVDNVERTASFSEYGVDASMATEL
ncbi:hypothetical protein GGR55DRAFT_677802 [Xylaria sp. FL0064]|nr:hypothetical protein GGR55DRAFT_677802 [Xylaria sp. FL0064]